MPIRRPRGPKPTLRHVAFLEAAASLPERSPARDAHQAGFLTLRLLDEWVSLGGLVSEATSQSQKATRAAVEAISGDGEVQTALTRIVDAVMMLHDADAQPVLPRVFAYGSLLEHRGQITLAADVYATVSRHVDTQAHLDLAFDAQLKQGFCFRLIGDLDLAQRAYETAGMLAARAKDRVRVLFARIGESKVTWSRGNLPAADEALAKIVAEAEAIGDQRLLALALHDHAALARMREDLPRAIRLAFESFKRMTTEQDRERVLSDLGNFLGQHGAFDSARAALGVLEHSARQADVRWSAQHNLMDLAMREGSEPRFERYRRLLDAQPLPERNAVLYLRDAGRGLAVFGRHNEAEDSLRRGLGRAEAAGMHQTVFEIESMLADLETLRRQEQRKRPKVTVAPPDIATTLDALWRETAGAA